MFCPWFDRKFVPGGAGTAKRARIVTTIPVEDSEQERNDRIKDDLLKSLQIHPGTEDGKIFLAAMSKAAEAYQGDLGSFWRNACFNVVNAMSAGKNLPDFEDGAQVVKGVLESSLLLTACIKNTSVLGKDVLSFSLDCVRDSAVCGRCGYKGHFHNTCFQPVSRGNASGKGFKGKGTNQGGDFTASAPFAHHPGPFGHFGPRPPPF